MRAAVYARYSSDLQSANSIEDQMRLCRERIDRDGGTIVEAYTDYALSGGSLRNRAGMQALLQDAKAGAFDVVVAEALDRVSRDQEDIAGIYKRLKHADVKLVTLAEGEVNELHVGLKGTMSALFLQDLAQKTRRGQRGRVEAGRIPGGNSFGYRMVRQIGADGSVSTGERESDPAQAAVVRRIFEEYAAGVAPRVIAKRLNAEGISGPRGGAWNASTINGNRKRRNGILNNDLYVGRITYNRQRFIKDPETGRRVSRLNPEHEWVTKEVPALRIIDKGLWQRVQDRKAGNAFGWSFQRPKRQRLLTGLLRCGRCGGGMTLARGDRYYCSARREKGTCDADRGIRAAEVEERVLAGLEDILAGKEDLLESFVAAFKAEAARQRRQRRGKSRGLGRELAKVERGIARCLDYITAGDGDPGAVRPQLLALERRKREIESELAIADRDVAVDLHPNLAELYRRKVEALTQVLTDEAARPQAVEIIRALIERIEVHPGEKRGDCDVILVGALASILAFAQTDNTAASGGDGGTFLVVAGAGFEPATFRL